MLPARVDRDFRECHRKHFRPSLNCMSNDHTPVWKTWVIRTRCIRYWGDRQLRITGVHRQPAIRSIQLLPGSEDPLCQRYIIKTKPSGIMLSHSWRVRIITSGEGSGSNPWKEKIIRTGMTGSEAIDIAWSNPDL